MTGTIHQAWSAFERMESWFAISRSSHGRTFAYTWADGLGNAGTKLVDLKTGAEELWNTAGSAVVALKAESLRSAAALLVSAQLETDLEFIVHIDEQDYSYPLTGDRWALASLAEDSYIAVPQHGQATKMVMFQSGSMTEIDLGSLIITSIAGTHATKIYVNAHRGDGDVRLTCLGAQGSVEWVATSGHLGIFVDGAWLASTSVDAPHEIYVSSLHLSYRPDEALTLKLDDDGGQSTVCAISADGLELILGTHRGVDDASVLVNVRTGEHLRLNGVNTSFGMTAFFFETKPHWVESSPRGGPTLLGFAEGTDNPSPILGGPLVPWGMDISVRYDQTRDGSTTLESIVLKPSENEFSRTIVVCLHGGPRSRWSLKYDQILQLIVQSGAEVVAPNPRGSSWTNEEFEAALRYRWGDVDRTDVADIVRNLKEENPTAQFILLGQSYGAYLGFQSLLSDTNLWDGAILGASFASPEHLYAEASEGIKASLVAQDAIPSTWAGGNEEHSLDGIRAWVVHGSQDQIVSPVLGEQVHQVLDRLGAESRWTLIQGAGHQPFAGDRKQHHHLAEYISSFQPRMAS